MSRFLLVGKILLIIIFLGVLFLVIKYAGAIRTLVADNSVKSVKSASTSLEKEIKRDFEEYLDSAKKQVLDIKIKDIVTQVMKIQKVSEDYKRAKNELESGVKEIFK